MKLYKFNELSKKAQENAVNEYIRDFEETIGEVDSLDFYETFRTLAIDLNEDYDKDGNLWQG